MNNFILLYGEVLDYPQQASIDKKGTEYYKFNFAVQRESGIIDILPIVVEEDTAAYNALADIPKCTAEVNEKAYFSRSFRPFYGLIKVLTIGWVSICRTS